jgi:hypothetical protein
METLRTSICFFLSFSLGEKERGWGYGFPKGKGVGGEKENLLSFSLS